MIYNNMGTGAQQNPHNDMYMYVQQRFRSVYEATQYDHSLLSPLCSVSIDDGSHEKAVGPFPATYIPAITQIRLDGCTFLSSLGICHFVESCCALAHNSCIKISV